MHQTFYIDIDEEITSIVERLKKARASEVVIVVPRRALLIQSIVNLRILKREADDAGIQLMIVTQDKLGKILIEKAGIFVQQKMDNIPDDEIGLEDKKEETEEEKKYLTQGVEESQKGNNRLDGIGSDSYFDEEGEVAVVKNKKNDVSLDKKGKEKLINKELVGSSLSDIRKKTERDLEGVAFNRVNASVDSGAILSHNNAIRTAVSEEVKEVEEDKKDPLGVDRYSSDKKLDNFFYQKNDNSLKDKRIPKKEFQDYNLSGKAHRWFWVFGIISAIFTLGVLAYFFVPRAQVSLSVKTGLKSVDSEVTGKVGSESVDLTTGIIPAKMVEFNQEVVKSYEATGSKSVSNQKARGMITIYNEYDKNPQSLVATTRFLTEDGKLFRLVKAVIVPGMTEKDGQIVSGSIEAQVVADQSGSEFNIEPAKFKIPGFQNSGNEKYNKFYAESKEKMSGGGEGSEEANFITAQDVTTAKAGILAEIEQAVKNQVAKTAGEDFVVLDGATEKKEPVYKLSNSEGDVVNSFSITAQTATRSLAVNKKDLNAVVAQMIAMASGSASGINEETINFDFGKPNVNFEEGIIDIKFHASAKLKADLDLETIKGEILGKREADLTAYLSTFSDIEKVRVSYQPSFLNGRIPFRRSQVTLGLDKE